MRVESRSGAFAVIGLLGLIALLGLGAVGCDDASRSRASRPAVAVPVEPTDLNFTVSFSDEMSAEALDGRLLLLISAAEDGEPRFQVGDAVSTAQVFGVDVEGWGPGTEAEIDGTVFGYPAQSLAHLPAGSYRVQALLNRYQTYTRSDGHTVKLPPDMGEGQQWARKPGNLYSTPIEVRVDPRNDETIRITLEHEIPPIEGPADTEWVKHIRMRSDLLSEFWGTDVYLGAHVLLPAGFDENPNVLVIRSVTSQII